MIKLTPQADGTLTEKQIVDLVNHHNRDKYYENELYYRGLNPPIFALEAKAEGVPDNRVPVPYARKMVKTVKGYMFSKQIKYVVQDEQYQKDLLSIFKYNKEPRKTSEIGRNLITHGRAYELHYMKNVGGMIIDCFAVVENNEAIIVYSDELEPVRIAGIRHYFIEEGDDTLVRIVEVYYPRKSFKYKMNGSRLILIGQYISLYNTCPMIDFRADKHEDGLFDCVKPLIDGIDTLVSGDLNETQKFELAYLVLKGQKIKSDDLEKIKEKRFFELDKESTLEYLKNEINDKFRGDVKAFFVHKIYEITGIPDFTDDKFLSSDSGKALRLKLVDLDNTCDELETSTRDGLYDRLRLINDVLLRGSEPPVFGEYDKEVEMTFTRNLPEDLLYKLQIAEKMKLVGFSQRSILDFCPMVVTTDEELKRIEDEAAAYVDLNNIDVEDDNKEVDQDE